MSNEVSGDGFDHHQEELHLLSNIGGLDDLYLDVVSPPFSSCMEDIKIHSDIESRNSKLEGPNEEKSSYALPSASMEILKQCRSKAGTANGKKIHGPSCDNGMKKRASANRIIELAAWSFIQSSSAIKHPYASTSLYLSTEDQKDIQLVQNMLSCAERVHSKQYDSASKLLEEFHRLSSSKTSPVQRLVCYFIEALRDKIDRENGLFSWENMMTEWSLDVRAPNSAKIALFEKIPPIQVAQFACIQTVADHLSGCGKVHIIDLEVRCGVQETVLMQALAARSEPCPIESYKITALADYNSKIIVEETGTRLKTLAESLDLINFSYHIVRLEDILNHQEDPFVLDDGEAVIVHAAYFLMGMIDKPDQLEALMRAIAKVQPRAMIITETEANVNSPVFVNRFVEALFFYGAYFDCLHDFLDNDVGDRTFAESKIFGPAIRNAVAAEGDERKLRIVGINIWRVFFARFGMVEIPLSKLAIHHAYLASQRFDCGDSCTLDCNGNSLIIGWKGTPVFSLSAWKFSDVLPRRKFRI